MDRLQGAMALLDYAAVFVFGATGALAAARRKHDIVTFGFFAAITGVGGGTLRDLILDAPVFWVAQPAYLVVCLVAGAAVWVLGDRRFRAPLLLWLDALGMAAYSVVGAA
ncbi:MAG TPA: TRIC cation channel family protein, partial [Phenylobacterium sp.]